MLNNFWRCLAVLVLILGLTGCESTPVKPKIGVSLGVGAATRWKKEQVFMEERAKELGMDIEVRLNQTDKPMTQTEDCLEMIASGISVLILTPRNVREMDEILAYARQKQVKVISYARAVLGGSVDLFVGFDCYKIGQSAGQHLTEKVYNGDIILLKGDINDFNTPMLYYGAMKYIRPLVESGNIRLILDEYVVGWSPQEAKKLVRQAVLANGNRVNGIHAPNDLLAGASAEVLSELGISDVVITGMDAELAAARRIVAGTQDATVYLDLKALATTAIDEAYNMATKKKVNVNSRLDNESEHEINAFLINGQVVTRENLDKVLIENGQYTREQVYGE